MDPDKECCPLVPLRTHSVSRENLRDVVKELQDVEMRARKPSNWGVGWKYTCLYASILLSNRSIASLIRNSYNDDFAKRYKYDATTHNEQSFYVIKLCFEQLLCRQINEGYKYDYYIDQDNSFMMRKMLLRECLLLLSDHCTYNGIDALVSSRLKAGVFQMKDEDAFVASMMSVNTPNIWRLWIQDKMFASSLDGELKHIPLFIVIPWKGQRNVIEEQIHNNWPELHLELYLNGVFWNPTYRYTTSDANEDNNEEEVQPRKYKAKVKREGYHKVVLYPQPSLQVKEKAYPLRITNVVCTAWIGCNISLRRVQLATQGRLDVNIFPSCVSRSLHPRTTNSMFESGKVLTTGAPSVALALYSALLYVDKINSVLHSDLMLLNFHVQNLVSSFSLGYKLNIDMFYEEQRCTREGTTTFDSSLFRGCAWRITGTKQAFVLFESGKVVLTGSASWHEALMRYKRALPVLARYELGREHKQYDASFKRTRNIDICSQKK